MGKLSIFEIKLFVNIFYNKISKYNLAELNEFLFKFEIHKLGNNYDSDPKLGFHKLRQTRCDHAQVHSANKGNCLVLNKR